MSPRTLVARIDDALVGQLQETAGLWSFQYSEAWLSAPDRFALSPALPLQPEPISDGASSRPVQWYFDNLLPEEGQRTLLAKDARIDVADAFSLLAWYGAESAGSLTLLSTSGSSCDSRRRWGWRCRRCIGAMFPSRYS